MKMKKRVKALKTQVLKTHFLLMMKMAVSHVDFVFHFQINQNLSMQF